MRTFIDNCEGAGILIGLVIAIAWGIAFAIEIDSKETATAIQSAIGLLLFLGGVALFIVRIGKILDKQDQKKQTVLWRAVVGFVLSLTLAIWPIVLIEWIVEAIVNRLKRYYEFLKLAGIEKT